MAIILMAMNNNTQTEQAPVNLTDIQSQEYLGETLRVAGKMPKMKLAREYVWTEYSPATHSTKRTE